MAAQFAFGFRVKRAWNGHEIAVFVHDTRDMERLSEKEVVFQFGAFGCIILIVQTRSATWSFQLVLHNQVFRDCERHGVRDTDKQRTNSECGAMR